SVMCRPFLPVRAAAPRYGRCPPRPVICDRAPAIDPTSTNPASRQKTWPAGRATVPCPRAPPPDPRRSGRRGRQPLHRGGRGVRGRLVHVVRGVVELDRCFLRGHRLSRLPTHPGLTLLVLEHARSGAGPDPFEPALAAGERSE